jgi:hypothetical protein
MEVKPGERIALPALPVIKIENGVAVLKKTRVAIQDGCGARHIAHVETPFTIRGGFRVSRVTKYKMPSWAYTVRYETPWGTYKTEDVPRRQTYLDQPPSDINNFVKELLEKEGESVAKIIEIKQVKEATPVDVYIRKFQHVVVEIPADDYFIYIKSLGDADKNSETYFVYEFINESEAKLVDDIRTDYILHIFNHRLSSRAYGAQIKILGDAVWKEVNYTRCATESVAVAMVIAKYGSRFTIAKNDAPYRGCCEGWVVEEWDSTFPPRRISQYRSTDPLASDITPEDAV